MIGFDGFDRFIGRDMVLIGVVIDVNGKRHYKGVKIGVNRLFTNLLADREPARLADHEVGPLHDDDADQPGGLRVVERDKRC